MVTHALLELYAVAIGNGNVVHVHTEHQTAAVVSVGNGSSHARPNGYSLLCLWALPVSYHHLAWNAHTGADMTELDVAMSRLVEVHEVHVDSVPRQLGVVLGVEVEQRLLESLQTLNPHLGW